MKRRRLGASGLDVPAIAFGAYALGGGYWGRVDAAQAERAVQTALDLGMDAFDTAPVYGFGHSEEVLGRALAGRRDQALILTKVGLRWEGLRGVDDLRMPDRDGSPRKVERDSRPESVRAEVQASLRRLRVERIDLVQVHARDPRTPIAETMDALRELRREGLVRAIGVSNYAVDELDQALAALRPAPLASTQPQYSLLARDVEADVLPWARENGVGVLVYAPLAQGLLTGRVGVERGFDPREGRARNPRFSAGNRAKVNAVLDRCVAPIAERFGATIAQVVLAWTVSQAGITAALVGARTPEQVRENAAAGDLELAPEDHAAIDAGFRELELEMPRPSLAARLRARLFRRR